MKKSSEIKNQFFAGLGLFVAYLFVSCLVFAGAAFTVEFLKSIWYGDFLAIAGCILITVLISLALGMTLGSGPESVE